MSIRYQITHKERINNTTVTYRADLRDAQYSGSATQKLASDVFFEWEYDNLDERDIFEHPVQKSSFTIHLLAQQQADITLLNDILDAPEDRFYIDFYIDGSKVWTGAVLTDLIEYQEISFPFVIDIKAKDLSSLEGVEYEFTDIATLTRLSKIIAECLQGTGLSLPIRSYTNLTNEEITDNSEDFLWALYHQKFAFRKEKEPMTCLEALENICRAYNLIIRQVGGRWIIEQVPALARGNTTQYDYDVNGENPVSSVPDRVKDINRTDSFLLPKSVNKVTGALKSITSSYNHRTLLESFDFDDVTQTDPNRIPGKSFDVENTGRYDFGLSLDVKVIGTSSYDIGPAYIAVLANTSDGSTYKYENGGFSSSADDTPIPLDQSQEGSLSIGGQLPVGTVSVDIFFNWADVDGPPASVNYIDEIQFSNISANIVNSETQDWKAEIRYKYTRTGSYSVSEKVGATILGDGPTVGPTLASPGRPATDDFEGDIIEPGNFKVRGSQVTFLLQELMLRERLSMRRDSLQNMRASMWINYTPENLISYRGGTWFFLGGRFKAKDSRWDGNIIKLDYRQEAGDAFQTIVEEGGTPAGDSGGSSSTSGNGISLELADSRYFQISKSLSEGDATQIRNNLGIPATYDFLNDDFSNVTDWSIPDNRFLKQSNNLSEITTIAGAKTFQGNVNFAQQYTDIATDYGGSNFGIRGPGNEYLYYNDSEAAWGTKSGSAGGFHRFWDDQNLPNPLQQNGVIDNADNAAQDGLYLANGSSSTNFADAYTSMLVSNRYGASNQLQWGRTSIFHRQDAGDPWKMAWNDQNLAIQDPAYLESIDQNLGTGDDVEFRAGTFTGKLTADSIYTPLLYAELFKKDVTEVINGRLAVGNSSTIERPSSEKGSSRARVFPQDLIFSKRDYIHISGEDENGVYNLYGQIQETGAGTYYYAVYKNGSQWQGGFDRVKEGDTIMKVNGNLILMESNDEPYIGIYQDIDSIVHSPFNDNQGALTTLLGGLDNVPASANWGTQLHESTKNGIWTSGAWLENAHVKGEIEADEGYLNNLDVTGTLTFPNPYSSSVDGKISSSGIDLVYNGSQSQEISWYGGLGSDVLNLSADNDGGQVHSDFDLNLSGNNVNVGSGLFNEVHFKGETHTDRAFYINDRFILENVSEVIGQDNTYYSIGGASLVYMTVGNNEPYVYKIENPEDGQIVRIMANGNGRIHVVDINNTPSEKYGNIKLQSGTVDIYGQTYRTFIYYDGYWRLSADYGS